MNFFLCNLVFMTFEGTRSKYSRRVIDENLNEQLVDVVQKVETDDKIDLVLKSDNNERPVPNIDLSKYNFRKIRNSRFKNQGRHI